MAFKLWFSFGFLCIFFDLALILCLQFHIYKHVLLPFSVDKTYHFIINSLQHMFFNLIFAADVRVYDAIRYL